MQNDDDVTIIYDSECPVCTAYSCSAVVGEDGAKPRLIGARGDDKEVTDAVAAGLDLDDGMVVLYKGQRYHGADAMHILAVAAPKKGWFGAVNRLLFGSRTIARAIYPVLRCGRNTLLFLLGKKKIGARAQEQGKPEVSDAG